MESLNYQESNHRMKAYTILITAYALLFSSEVMAGKNGLPNIAIYQIESRSVTKDEAVTITEMIAVAVGNTYMANVMERSQMEQILKEQGFQNSGSCDGSECIVQVGQLLGVEKAVIGSIGKLDKSWILNLRIVNIQTGLIEKQTSQQFSGSLSDINNALIKPSVITLFGNDRKIEEKEESLSLADTARSNAFTILFGSTSKDVQAKSDDTLPISWHSRVNAIQLSKNSFSSTLTINAGYSRIVQNDMMPFGLMLNGDFGIVHAAEDSRLYSDGYFYHATLDEMTLRLNPAIVTGYKRVYVYSGPSFCLPLYNDQEKPGFPSSYWQITIGCGAKLSKLIAIEMKYHHLLSPDYGWIDVNNRENVEFWHYDAEVSARLFF